MAAGEDQPQPFVGHDGGRLRRGLIVDRPRALNLGGARSERAVVAQAVDRAVAGDRDDPRGRIAGQPVARPAFERGRERVLDRLLGDVPVTERANQRRDRSPEVLAKEPLDCDRRAQDAAGSPVAVAARAAYAS